MRIDEFHTVTGAYGYSGKYIASLLLNEGKQVRTLTNSPDRPDPFNGRVQAFSFHFDQPELLVQALRGTRVLYNTYWVRFNQADFKHKIAVENTRILFWAAKEAGVERIIHVSITNPSINSPLEYFRGKAELELALIDSGMSYAILRPAILFGKEDILINNIAWTLRNLPIFGVFGDGSYSLQPIYVGDLADMAVLQGLSSENMILDAIGPETFSYRDLIVTLGQILGFPRPLIYLPPEAGYLIGNLIGRWKDDVLITREEIKGLMANLLCTHSSPSGRTRFTEWAQRNKDDLGFRYASELARRRNRTIAYV